METKRLLLVEDNEVDADILVLKLKADGMKFDYKVTDQKPDLENLLDTYNPELIISDYNLPDFDGLDVLRMVRERNQDMPFIFVSGTLGEERAVEAVKMGANDFVLKRSLTRLPMVVKRALNDFEIQQERKRLGEQLMTLNQELEKKVQERTEALNIANKELEAFNFTVSHDLRTPLAAIEIYLSLLTEQWKGQTDLVRAYIQNANVCVKEMHTQIHDLLAYSLMGRRQKQLELFDMDELFRKAFREIQRTLDEQLIHFKVEELPQATGDPSMIKHVAGNLLSNAIKFSKTRDIAEILVTGKKGKSENVYSVKDNGIGFSQANAKKIFGVFQRLEKREDYEGTGAGLAIVERIIQRHGGRVWAEGKEGEGATFFFSLPNSG